MVNSPPYVNMVLQRRICKCVSWRVRLVSNFNFELNDVMKNIFVNLQTILIHVENGEVVVYLMFM